MALHELLTALEDQASVTPVTPCNPVGETMNTAPTLVRTSVTPVTPVADENINGARKLPEPTTETSEFLSRSATALARLRADISLERVVDVDTSGDPERIIVTIALRSVAVCEFAIPRAKYDPWKFLELFEKHGGERVH